MATLLAAALLMGCSGIREEEQPAHITEAEARRLAAEHVNSKLEGHVWQTALGGREFVPVEPGQWNGVVLRDSRLVLRCGGRRGQEFTVSMRPDGSDIRLERHGYALR